MTVLINSVETPVTFETEKTLDDAVRSLTDWIESQNYAVSSLLVDGVAAQRLDPRTTIEAIATIELEAIPTSQRRLQRIDVYRAYFELLHRSAVEGRDEVLNDLRSEWNDLYSSAVSDLPIRVVSAMSDLDFSNRETLATSAHSIVLHVSALYAELSDPKGAFDALTSTVPSLLERLSTLSIDLQKGQDRLAMDKIVELINFLEDALRLVEADANASFLPENFDAQTWKTELKTFLTEIESALSAQDFVLVSDLVEYEICPRVESLTSLQKSL